jgi:nicotinamide mononucleotide transporter PnuC
MKTFKITKYFSKAEIILYLSSLTLITLSFLIFDRSNYLSLLASLVGATSLIFCSKGNPIGEALIIVFSLLYAYISYSYAYYGEMITYLGMSAPMAIFALVSWLKNPYNGNKSEVRVNKISAKEGVFLVFLTALVTVVFYFILGFLGTSNLLISTVSVTTSFFAVYLTARRSAYYALAYAFNDLVLIILWIMATIDNLSYVSVIVCFVAFLANDLYGFYNWRRMERRQNTRDLLS